MNLSQVEPPPWPRHRWWLLIVLVFAAHLGLIFAFGSRKPVLPRRAVHAPALQVIIGRSELMALDDPTLFALPHPRGFASAAWLQLPQVSFPPFKWTALPQWLALPGERLGDTFLQFVQTNTFARFELPAMPPPELTLPEASSVRTTAVAQSTLQVEDDLAQRRLLNPVELPSWPGADLLTNSVVRVWVDAPGKVLSVTPVPPGSGSIAADRKALDLAKTARFTPLPGSGNLLENPVGPLTRGLLIFRWHTIPLPATNTPPAKP